MWHAPKYILEKSVSLDNTFKSLLLNLRNLIHCGVANGAVGKTLPFHSRLKLFV
jgi:hypothetical protein